MSLGLGDIDKAAINSVTDKLTAALAGAGPEATEAINAALDHFNVIGSALESRTMADVLTDVKAIEDPILKRLDTLLNDVASLILLVGNGFDISVAPKVIAGTGTAPGRVSS